MFVYVVFIIENQYCIFIQLQISRIFQTENELMKSRIGLLSRNSEGGKRQWDVGLIYSLIWAAISFHRGDSQNWEAKSSCLNMRAAQPSPAQPRSMCSVNRAPATWQPAKDGLSEQSSITRWLLSNQPAFYSESAALVSLEAPCFLVFSQPSPDTACFKIYFSWQDESSFSLLWLQKGCGKCFIWFSFFSPLLIFFFCLPFGKPL